MRSEKEIRERLNDLKEREKQVETWRKPEYSKRIKDLEYVLGERN